MILNLYDDREKMNLLLNFILFHCPNEIIIKGEALNNRCDLDDCVKCWEQALQERGLDFEIVHK